MADRATEQRWLEQLTSTPTAPGHEHRVMDWVRTWAGRRGDLKVKADEYGNLLVTQKGRLPAPPVVAVAHTDHPGFVVTSVDGRQLAVEFRGGVRPQYFDQARVEFFDQDGRAHRGRLDEFDHEKSQGSVSLDRSTPLVAGDIGRWFFGSNRGGAGERFILAPACDDLAGAAAALAALDRARSDRSLRNFGVLLTRGEEVGLVGAIGACRAGTLIPETRVLSIECSRSFPESPLGGGPIVRVGDASSVFDHEMTNRIADAARAAGIKHQRKLMAGGSCEATAFVAYGYRSTGLCLPLGNYHNMGNLDEVEQGKGMATPLPEVISRADFDGLVGLLLLSARAVDAPSSLAGRLDERFESQRHILQ
jgi:putative aminopeptidase FrvX